jgi:stage II sporulation protein D
MMGFRWRTSAARIGFGVLVLLEAGCGPPVRPVATSPEHTSLRRSARTVRVGVAVGVERLSLRLRGAWQIEAGGLRRTLADGGTLRCAALGHDLVVSLEDGSELRDPRTAHLDPRGADARLEYDGVPYRGRFTIRYEDGRLTLVDLLDVEAYLQGVVTWEIGRLGADARAAVEAQAVAARTYTLAHLGHYDALGFDLYGDERDQVFKGDKRDDPVADAAIRATRGLVLENGGHLVHAYYSSTCGGHTSWIDHVWPKPAEAYLQGRRDADAGGRSFCSASKWFRWTEAWSGAELERTLQETLPRALQLPSADRVGALVDLRVLERDASARVLALEVRTTTGTYTVRGDSIRWVLRPHDRPLLRSIMFELEVERTGGAIVRVVARGGGNGHGVGMCQNGAIGMARAGYGVEAILQHYYPGTALRRRE